MFSSEDCPNVILIPLLWATLHTWDIHNTQGLFQGQAVAYLVQALCYELEGQGSSPDEVINFFSIYLILSSHTMALGPTQPLAEMGTRNASGE
jgi:hypothetical protein